MSALLMQPKPGAGRRSSTRMLHPLGRFLLAYVKGFC
jgi:hypothetical protein